MIIGPIEWFLFIFNLIFKTRNNSLFLFHLKPQQNAKRPTTRGDHKFRKKHSTKTGGIQKMAASPPRTVLPGTRNCGLYCQATQGEPHPCRSEERRVGKECRSQWSA